jgi:hypothetical protein
MRKTGKQTSVKAKRLTIGLAGFEKISAVEGIRLTQDMRRVFRGLEARNASAAERRSVIAKRYGRSS